MSALDALKARIYNGERILADGAMGTELMKQAVLKEGTVFANLELPQIVQDIHKSYRTSGAEILTCNTFGTPPQHTSDMELWKKGFVVGQDIALSYSELAWCSVYPELLLQNSSLCHLIKTEILLIETCTSIKSACLATNTAKLNFINFVIVTCHFDANGKMLDGTTPEQAAKSLENVGADIIGGNCGEARTPWREIALKMRSESELPLCFQPGAGLPQKNTSIDDWAKIGKELFDVGAQIVGGCCGTTPKHIETLRNNIGKT